MLSDQSLSEAVIALQGHDLAPETRAVVDEAARLLGEGREGEARAMVDRAGALMALGDSAATGKEDLAAPGNSSRRPALQAIIAPLAAKLATGFTGLLTSVLEDIHAYTGDQIQMVAKSLQERIEQMQTDLRETSGPGERLEQLAHEQQASLVNHVDAVALRFLAIEERVTTLDRFAQEMPVQVESIVARLDGHTETLQVLGLRQTQRVAALNQVLDSLARLREPETAEMGMSAVA